MRGRILAAFLVLTGALLTGAAYGQKLPEVPVSRQTWATFAALGAEVVADGVTTRVLYQRGYDETNPMARPFVHAGVRGQVGGSLLGAASVGGVWFGLRRTHHDRVAMWFLRTTTAAEGCNVARQFAILRTSKK